MRFPIDRTEGSLYVRRLQFEGDADTIARHLGAKTFHEMRAKLNYYSQHEVTVTKYYYGEDGREICHYLRDVDSLCIFDTPRVWGIPHDNKPLIRKYL